MSLSPIVGFFIAGGVIFFTIVMGGSTNTFLDIHALIIVVGGTLSASLISFPFKTLFNLMIVFVKRLFNAKGQKQNEVIQEVLHQLKGYRSDSNFLKNNGNKIKDHFLKEAVSILNEGGIEIDKVIEIVSKRASTHHKRYKQEAKAFQSIAKFPPAFGLLGAVIGLIDLMQGIGSEDALQKIGPAMAIAMVATFYGIALANFILLPIAENLSLMAEEDFRCRKIVVEGIKYIYLKEHPIYVNEMLLSHLLPGERKIAA